jgi:serine/threonine protein kinase
MATCYHPNLAQLAGSAFTFISPENGTNLVIPIRYYSGGDLQQEITEARANGKPLESLRFLKIFTQTASALNYLHKKNIIHRDVKPGNIFRDNDSFVLGKKIF